MNKIIGNDTEKLLLELLKSKGYWCHLFAYNKNGQPCDIVAIRDNVAILIDVKHCDSARFNFSRIEPNQRNCFKYADFCGNDNLGFAIYFQKTKHWKWLSNDKVRRLEQLGFKSASEKECEELPL